MVIGPEKSYKKVFLAGPIKGAPNWQIDAIHKLEQLDDGFIIANPRTNIHADLDEQIWWETQHLRTADYIIFYIPEMELDIPGRHYAQKTRFELGECLARAKANGTQKIFVCIHESFPGKKYIKYKVEEEYKGVAEWVETEAGIDWILLHLAKLNESCSQEKTTTEDRRLPVS